MSVLPDLNNSNNIEPVNLESSTFCSKRFIYPLFSNPFPLFPLNSTIFATIAQETAHFEIHVTVNSFLCFEINN